MNEHDAEIGAAVRRLRQAAGLSQEELAAKLGALGVEGMWGQTVAKIEAGKRALKYREGVRLAQALGVEAGAILHGEDDLDLYAGLMEQLEAVRRAKGAFRDALAGLMQTGRAAAAYSGWASGLPQSEAASALLQELIEEERIDPVLLVKQHLGSWAAEQAVVEEQQVADWRAQRDALADAGELPSSADVGGA